MDAGKQLLLLTLGLLCINAGMVFADEWAQCHNQNSNSACDPIRIDERDYITLIPASDKGTCDSSLDGRVVYEKVASVGITYICRQTALGVYAWIALH
jgi:hypothetical protein